MKTPDPRTEPERQVYRDYEIVRRYVTFRGPPQPDEWDWSHPDYDGPGDRRCGCDPTLADCRESIDALIDD